MSKFSRLEKYWTVRIAYDETMRNKWTPTEATGPFSVITRGNFKTRDEACRWASRELGPGNWMGIEVFPFTKNEVGCIVDGAGGHDRIRGVLADFAESEGLLQLAADLRGEMSDDAGEEYEAIEKLNELCAPGVHFEMYEGDLMLMPDGCPDCGESDGHGPSCPASL